MDSETTTETGTATEEKGGEEGVKTEEESITVPKKDYDVLNQTLGSLKRELKDLKQAKEDSKETSQKTKPDEALLQRIESIALRQAGITHQDDIDLARRTAKKWGMNIEEVLTDDDFKAKLERQQSSRANAEATSTSNVRGVAASTTQKDKPEYWLAKGRPPTRDEVPDRKTRATIAKAFIDKAKTGKTFYNE